MQQITSVQNPLIKKVSSLQQKKGRNEAGLFLIEGYKGVTEALLCGIEVENIFIKEDFKEEIENFSQEKIYVVSEAVMKKISTTDTPPGIVATAKQFKHNVDDIKKDKNSLILLLENIKDPGNFGTIIRTAAACNVSGIVLTDETVDIFNPKIVRSSVANLWKVPIVFVKGKSEIKKSLKLSSETELYATVVNTDNAYFNEDYTKPVVLMFGSEAEGLSEELIKQSDKRITIPMNKNVESLNLSVSVGVVLYEVVRQRQFSK